LACLKTDLPLLMMHCVILGVLFISAESLRQIKSHIYTPLQGDKQNQLKIAFATMLAHEPHDGSVGFLDSWGILAESIRTHMGHLQPELIAIVTPKVKKSRRILTTQGWTVYEGKLADTSLIRSDELRKTVEGNGCCGSAEILKAEPLLWTQYDRVVLTDTDTLVHHSFEELFHFNKTLIWSSGLFQQEHLQAGFMVFKPNPTMHQEMMDIWHRGHFDSSGWEKSGIGYYYGGATISGVLPYMFMKLHPEEGHMVDPCRYNHNGADKTFYKLQLGEDEAHADPYCEGFNFRETVFNHFTGCPKPWDCAYGDPQKNQTEACKYFIRQWFVMRRNVAAKFGQNVSREPCTAGHSYEQVSFSI